MAYQLKLRTDTAANWSSTNPVLAIGEIADTYDTLQFKIGDGVTAWNSLANQGATGPAQTVGRRSFGDGSDGTVSISSGTTTLTRDMYYNNLTMSGTGQIDTNGYKIFVKGVLNLRNAMAAAITNVASDGNAASGATGGAAPTAQVAGTVGIGTNGGGGATGNTGGANNGSSGSALTGNGGNGGWGTAGAGEAGGNSFGGIATLKSTFGIYQTNLISGVTLIGGGGGGSGGNSGAGDGTNAGGGGGSGGQGGGVLAIYANIISRDGSTPVGTITAPGGMGGASANGVAGTAIGGGGAGGGGGGWVYICYNQLSGSTVTNMITARGGNGAAGGNGATTANGGNGGNGGMGGRITILNMLTGVGITRTARDVTFSTSQLASYVPVPDEKGNPQVAGIGGSGGIGQLTAASL